MKYTLEESAQRLEDLFDEMTDTLIVKPRIPTIGSRAAAHLTEEDIPAMDAIVRSQKNSDARFDEVVAKTALVPVTTAIENRNKPTFNFDHIGVVAEIDPEGTPWFSANEICQILGYSNPRKAVGDHCETDGVTKRYTIDNMGRNQVSTFIDQGNVFRLITKSKKPEAKAFEKWVFDTVLPTIARTGYYSISDIAEVRQENLRLTKAVNEARTLTTQGYEQMKLAHKIEKERTKQFKMSEAAISANYDREMQYLRNKNEVMRHAGLAIEQQIRMINAKLNPDGTRASLYDGINTVFRFKDKVVALDFEPFHDMD